MRPDPCVWVFHGAKSGFPAKASAVFSSVEMAEYWIRNHGLSGTLSAFPLDEGMYDWAIRKNAISMKPDKLAEKLGDAGFIVDCLPASIDHFHYENGISDQERFS